MNIRWAAETDISIAEDEELLSLAYKTGCGILFIGFESLNGKSPAYRRSAMEA